MKAAIFCGTRRRKATVLVDRALSDLVCELLLSHLVVFHGAAPGVDSETDRLARGRGMSVVPVPAQWEKYGVAAGSMRNQVMLKILTYLRLGGYEVCVFAFPDSESVGTRDMIRIAQQEGVPVTVQELSDANEEDD